MLSTLDWLIIVVLVGGLIRGYIVGAVRQVASLIGLAVAFLFSVEFMGMVGNAVVSALGVSDSFAPLAGFTVLFLGIYLLFLVLSRLVERVIDTLSLSVVNRAAGSAVGGFKAALLLSLLFLVLTGMELPDQRTRSRSALYYPVVKLLPETIEAAESWFPAAKDAADELGRHVRSEVDVSPNGSSTADSARLERRS